jgi:hypothetical protein
MLREIYGVAQRRRSVKERWRANRIDNLAKQGHLSGVASSQLRRSFDNRHVDPVAPEIGLASIDCGNPHLDLGMKCGEPAEARHQPPYRECCGCCDGENAYPSLVSHAFAGEHDAVQSSAGSFQEGSAIGSQLDAAMETLKQTRSKMLLKRSHLMTDGTLGEREFLRRLGE